MRLVELLGFESIAVHLLLGPLSVLPPSPVWRDMAMLIDGNQRLRLMPLLLEACGVAGHEMLPHCSPSPPGPLCPLHMLLNTMSFCTTLALS